MSLEIIFRTNSARLILLICFLFSGLLSFRLIPLFLILCRIFLFLGIGEFDLLLGRINNFFLFFLFALNSFLWDLLMFHDDFGERVNSHLHLFIFVHLMRRLSLKLDLHVVCIFIVCIILLINVHDFITKDSVIETDGSAIGDTNSETAGVAIEHILHLMMRCSHQFGGNAQFSVRPKH